MIGFICTPGFEAALSDEIAPVVREPSIAAPGVVVAERMPEQALDPVFARQLLPDARIIRGPSVAVLAEAAYSALESAVDDARGPFTLHAYSVPVDDDAIDAHLGSRIALIGRQALALLSKRRRRAFARYVAAADFPAAMAADATLLQLAALEADSALASAASPRPLPRGGFTLAPWAAGVAPVAIDRTAPSRAYQKLEESFQWMSAAPGPADVCVDLGAAPGGWTMTALKRGARVIAVDRVSLEPPAAPHPRLSMVIGNAFTYAPAQCVDWLLCDVVAEPQRTVELVARWLRNRWCRAVVCTVKFKGRAGYGALAPLPALLADAGFRFARVKQLGHNKNEATVMGVL